MVLSRRARRHEQTRQEIKQIARQQMAQMERSLSYTRRWHLPNSAPESPCASARGMKGAFLYWGKGTGAMPVKNVCS